MTTDSATNPASDYPVRLSVDYPEGPRNRLTALFRLFLAIPIIIVLALLSGGSGSGADSRAVRWDGPSQGLARGGWWMPGYIPAAGATRPADVDGDGGRWRFDGPTQGAAAGGGIVVIPTVLMLLFRQKYPRWWFEWNRELYRFGARVGAYVLLLRDEYPSTDEEQAVHLAVDYPDAMQLNRWLPLVKWLLAIPHYVVLIFLVIGVLVATLVAWLAILVTGSYPRGLYDYTVGVVRWGARVSGYAFLLVTDRYPPFSLQ